MYKHREKLLAYRKGAVYASARKRYNKSDKGRATNAKYQRSEARKRYLQSPARKAANAKYRLASKYGITQEIREGMLVAQAGRCAVCTEPMRSPHLDHDHGCCPGDRSCGACIRGLLCLACNTLLGYARDSRDVLLRAVAYLDQNAARRPGPQLSSSKEKRSSGSVCTG